MDGTANHLFQLILGVSNFTIEVRIGEIAEVGMGHGVTADVEASITELAHLAGDQITGAPQKAEGDVKSGSEIHLAQNRRGYGQVGFAPVVKRDDNSAGSFLSQCVRD